MAASVYTFKIALKGAKEIWRRIAIRDNQTLNDLHWAIFEAFDREEEHLYAFYLPKPGAKGRARPRDAREYGHPFIIEDDLFDDDTFADATKTKLKSLGLKPDQQLDYLFDFGDSWWHEITLEKMDELPDKKRYPRILEKHGASPPQYPDVE